MSALTIFARAVARGVSPVRFQARARRIRVIAERARWRRLVAAARVVH